VGQFGPPLFALSRIKLTKLSTFGLPFLPQVVCMIHCKPVAKAAKLLKTFAILTQTVCAATITELGIRGGCGN